MSEPLVTVVVPLYNGARHLNETLMSIDGQTIGRSQLQVIVVDDGSVDDGPLLAAAHPVRPTVVSQPNLGVAVARNRGLALASGRWVTFLDQDDLWHSTRLERLLETAQSGDASGILATSEIAFDTTDEQQGLAQLDPAVRQWASLHAPAEGTLAWLSREADTTGSDEALTYSPREMLTGPITVTTSFLAPTELLRLAGGFAPHASALDDYWLLVNAARLAPLTKVDQPTAFYRVHLSATSRRTSLGIPFLTSALALRYGGQIEAAQEGDSREWAGDFHRHLLRELVESPEYRTDPDLRARVRRLASLVWRDGSHRRIVARAELDRVAPAAIRAIRRSRSDSR